MPCWRACGPARWGRRSSYGNGFGNFSRYVTEPRDLPSESSRPTPDIRLFALIRAIVSPWKGISEPPSFATVKYRLFSSIPLPYQKKQGDAGGRRRAIAGLHGAVPLGMRGDPLRTRGTADRRPCRARFAGRAPRACCRVGRTPRSSGKPGVPALRKSRIRELISGSLGGAPGAFWRKGPCVRLHRGEHARPRAAGRRLAPAPPTARSGDI